MTLGFAIVAHNVDHTLQVGRHGLFGNVSSTRFPGSRHALLGDNRLFANGTAVIKAGKLAEAMCVNGMTAWKILWRLAGGKHVFAADGTVILVLILEAVVAFKDMNTNAHAALVTVTEVFGATNATKATLIAVKGFLRLGHPEITDVAVVFSKRYSTVSTLIPAKVGMW